MLRKGAKWYSPSRLKEDKELEAEVEAGEQAPVGNWRKHQLHPQPSLLLGNLLIQSGSLLVRLFSFCLGWSQCEIHLPSHPPSCFFIPAHTHCFELNWPETKRTRIEDRALVCMIFKHREDNRLEMMGEPVHTSTASLWMGAIYCSFGQDGVHSSALVRAVSSFAGDQIV